MAFRSVPRPSSPPGAKASTECPCYTRYPPPGSHPGTLSPGLTRGPPCTETILRPSCQGSVRQLSETTAARTAKLSGQSCKSSLRTLRTSRRAGITGSHQTPAWRLACATRQPAIRSDRSHASEPSPPTVGAPFSRTTIPGQTSDRTTGQDPSSKFSRQCADPSPRTRQNTDVGPKHTRPETHQNLIHTDKEHRRHRRPPSRYGGRPRTLCPGHRHTDLEQSAILGTVARAPSPGVRPLF